MVGFGFGAWDRGSTSAPNSSGEDVRERESSWKVGGLSWLRVGAQPGIWSCKIGFARSFAEQLIKSRERI